MSEEPRKTALIALLQRGRRDEHKVWEGLSDADKEAQGAPDRWAVKDIAAHISEWKDRDAARLEAAANGLTPDEPADFNAANSEIFGLHRNKSWGEVMRLESHAFESLVSAVEALSEDSLFDARSFEWTKGQTLAGIAANIGYQHPQEHLSEILSKRGNLDEAEAILVRMVEAMTSMDDSPKARGTLVYNLACFYALHGMPDRALENLSESFALRPDLLDWSKQDSDLDSLRSMATFQALYGT